MTLLVSLMLMGAAPPSPLSATQAALVAPLAGWGRQAQAHWDAGGHDAACALYRKILAAELAVYGPWHHEPLGTIDTLAGWLEHLGRWDDALTLRRRAAAAAERMYGPADYRAVDAAWAVRASRLSSRVGVEKTRRHFAAVREYRGAMEEFAAGRYPAAAAAVRRALKGTAEAIGTETPFHAACLGDLGLLHRLAAEYAEARPLLEEALKARERMLGPTHPAVATTLTSLALLLHETGDNKAALPLAVRALAIRHAVDGPRHPEYAVCLNNVALIRNGAGDPRGAYPIYRRVAEIHEAAAPGSINHANTLLNIGQVERDLGRYADATATLERAMRLMPAGHPNRILAMIALAGAKTEGGDPSSGVPLAQRAVLLAEKTHGMRHPVLGVCLNDLGSMHMALDDAILAKANYERAAHVRLLAYGAKHPEYAMSLNNLGMLHHAAGRYEEALASCRKAMEIVEAALGPTHASAALTMHNVALCLHSSGKPAEAVRLFWRAAAIQKKVLGEESVSYAKTLHNLALARLELGEHEAAAEGFRLALSIHDRVAGPRHRLAPLLAARLAQASAALRNHGAAVLHAEQALRLARGHLGRVAAGMSERQQLEAVAAYSGLIGLRLGLPEESAEESHGHVLDWKGAVLARQAQRRVYARLQADPLHRLKAIALMDATRQLAAAHASAAFTAEHGPLSNLKERLERELAGASAEFRAARRRVTSAGLAASLPEGVALVDFYSVHRLAIRPGLDRLTAWVVRRGRPAARVELGLSLPVALAVRAWRAALEKGLDGAREAAALRRMVWAPLEGHLGGARVVLVSPDGPVVGMPFAALPGGKGGRMLIEEVGVVQVTAPHTIPDLLAAAPPVKPTLLTLGGPDYDAERGGKPLAGAAKGWKALPCTEDEARAASSAFRSLESRGAARLLTGASATKPAAGRLLGRSTFVHLATHGYFAPPPESLSVGGLADGQATAALIARLHPGLYSGLVFAGANRPTEEDNGLLTALEVSEMDLSALDLTVLSACETALGAGAPAEGLLGLQRAFAVAGCRSVVSSLWSVDDAATSVLMARFYHHLWEKRLPKFEALRRAQLDVMRHPEWVEERAKRLAGTPGLRGLGKASEVIASGKAVRRSPPAWWAAWQLSGDWR